MPLQIDEALIQRALAVLHSVTAWLLIQHGTALRRPARRHGGLTGAAR